MRYDQRNLLSEAPINRTLYLKIKDILHVTYRGENKPANHLIVVLAMMVTGVYLGRHVQLYQVALWMPFNIQLLSIVRRFERFLENPAVAPRRFFKPFVYAMQTCFGGQTVYLIIDCTQVGKKCRSLMIAVAYHHTVLPIVWKTVQGGKGHVKGSLQKELLKLASYYFTHQQVVVLGDAEFSNAQVISWLRKQAKWDFVLRFQSSYKLKTSAQASWETTKALYKAGKVARGQVCSWEKVTFTESNQYSNLTVTVQWDVHEDDMLCLVSSLPLVQQPHVVYEMRFWIETLFGNHKSRGFQLARTQMTTPEHIDRLILVLAIATCMALGLGTHLVLIAQTKLVDRSDRRDLSLFQLGLRWFLRLLALDRLDEFKMVFSWAFKLPPAGFQRAT